MSTKESNHPIKGFNTEEKQKAIGHHKTAASNLEKAKDHHLKAVKHHQDDEHEKAKEDTIVAQEHMKLAHEAHKAVAKQHEITA